MTALEQLRDTFDGDSAGLWSYGGGVTGVDGALRCLALYYDPDPAFRAGGEARSLAAYSLTGSFLAVEMIQAASSGSSTEGWVSVYTDNPGSNALLWRTAFSTATGFLELQVVHRVAEVDTVVLAAPYDAQEHRWLRLSETAGTVHWDTSPDGFDWTTFTTAAPPPAIPLGALHVALGAGYTSPGDVGGGVALFDNVNVLPGELDRATITGNPGDPFLAVDVRPDYAVGTFVVDQSQLDGPDRLAWSDTDPGAWASIVCDVTQLNYRRGASRLQGLLTQVEAGTATVTLSDTLHAFDPMVNAESIHKGTPLRVRAWGYDPAGERWDAGLFTGEVDEVAVQYRKDDPPLVTITVVDLVGPLSAWESEGLVAPGAGIGDDLLERAELILDTVGRGELSTESDAPGSYVATLAPVTLERPWQDLLNATEAELGRLWVDAANRLVVRGRGSQLAGPVRGTLSDVHGEAPLGVHCCMEDAAVLYGVENLGNRAMASRRIATTTGGEVKALVVLEDEASQARYGVGVVDRRNPGLDLETDAQLQPWAGAVITANTKPELRVETVRPAPSLTDLDSALAAWPAVLRTDLGDRWLFRYQASGGQLVARGLGVLGIELQASPDGWSISWTTEDAPVPGAANPAGWFVLDLSELDGDDLLAPYPYPAPAPA